MVRGAGEGGVMWCGGWGGGRRCDVLQREGAGVAQACKQCTCRQGHKRKKTKANSRADCEAGTAGRLPMSL